METALLEAAAELLETEGPEALSVRRIAAAARVAPMGVYNHFSSKFGIVEALYEQGFERLHDAVASVGPDDDPLEDLREAGRRYRALALAHPMTYRLMFLRAMPGYEPSVHAQQMAARAFEALAAKVRRAMDAGALQVAPELETAQLIWSAVHGSVSLELMGLGFVEDHACAFDLVCASMLKGLSP
jgi:AcrR family transcriptional regulator